MASNVLKIKQSKPTNSTDAHKPAVVMATPAVVAFVATERAIPLVTAGNQTGDSSIEAHSFKPMAAISKRPAAAKTPVHPDLFPKASTRKPVVATLCAKVKVHLQALSPLLPIGEGAYQSAELHSAHWTLTGTARSIDRTAAFTTTRLTLWMANLMATCVVRTLGPSLVPSLVPRLVPSLVPSLQRREKPANLLLLQLFHLRPRLLGRLPKLEEEQEQGEEQEQREAEKVLNQLLPKPLAHCCFAELISWCAQMMLARCSRQK